MKEIRALILCDDVFYCDGLRYLINEIANENKMAIDIHINKETYSVYDVQFVFVQPAEEFFLSLSLENSHVIFISESQKNVQKPTFDYLSKEMSVLCHKRIMTQFFRCLIVNQRHRHAINKNGLDLLTPRKRSVLYLYSQGYSPHKIAKMENLSLKTVYSHKYQIMSAFGVKTNKDFYYLCNIISYLPVIND